MPDERYSELSDDENLLFTKIPLNGDSIGNKSLRTSLNWDEDKYWSVRDQLINRGFVLIGMGRGGSVYRLKHITSDSETPESPSVISPPASTYDLERDLYQPVSESLHKWAKELQFLNYFIEDTSSQGSRRTGGIWTRPDLVLINVATYQFVPNKYLDVITFEIKPKNEWSIRSVFEAAAHSRFASRSYLALHLDATNPPPEELKDRISEECERFGVGLIVFEDPANYDTYEFIVEPTRKSYDPQEVERFIELQISVSNKTKLSRLLR